MWQKIKSNHPRTLLWYVLGEKVSRHVWRSALSRPSGALRVFLSSSRPQLSLLPNVVGNHILLRNQTAMLSVCRKFSRPPTSCYMMQVLASFVNEGSFFLPLVLTHVHHVGLLGFMINRWITILYLHCNIFCWFDGKQKDTGEKGSRESIYRAKNEQPEKHKSAALYSESIHSRIRPQAVVLNPLCLPYDTHFHVSNYWGPATHMRSHNSWSMPLVIISTVLVALSFNTASALCQGIFGVELDYVCFCTSLQGPFHTSECYSRSWLSLGKERKYRCAWVALGPRVDDGDGCAGTCGDVFPHLHRQKSYNHQHFISLFIHTHVCSSHLRTSLTLILTSTKTTYKKAV